MRFEPNQAERTFAELLLDNDLEKSSAQLEPETADLLGIPTVSPKILNQLEQQADPGEQQEIQDEEPEQKPPPLSTPREILEEKEAPVEGQEVGGFERSDAPPPADEDEDEVAEPDLPSRLTHGTLFSDKRGHPLQMFEILNIRYGGDWAEWESETLYWVLRRDFGPVGDLSRNKIMSLRAAATTDMPWQDWDIFENCGLSWSDMIPIISKFQPMTPAQCAFTVRMLRAIREEEEFSNEVNAYTAAILVDHGYVFAPEEFFAGAQSIIDRKQDLLTLRVDVEKAWSAARKVDPETITWNDENPVDVHVLKLASVQRYLDERESLRRRIQGTSIPASSAPPIPSVP